MSTDGARLAWIALSLIPGLGGRTLARLLEFFGSAEAALAGDDAALQTVPGVGPKLSAAIQTIDTDALQTEIAAWRADGIVIALPGDEAYPAPLTGLDDAPPTLFVRGALACDPALWARSIAIVGTRQPREESRRIAGALAGTLAAAGWTVVSGLAAGIDTAAHTGACSGAGRTAAALGCGVRTIYPPQNGALAAQIQAQGALLSETHPDAAPSSPALVARNRLITGLSRAVIVIETGLTGGSLHAVRFAQAQNRPVYALAIDAPGNRRLIADGALPLPPTPAAWERLQRDLEG